MSERDRPSLEESSMHDGSTESRRTLDAVVVEARKHLDVRGPGAARAYADKDTLVDVDWSRLESRVMASIELEKPMLLRDVEHVGTRAGSRSLRAGMLALAAAAAVAVFVRRDRDVALTGGAVATSNESASASSLRATEGAGDVRIGGVVATPGYVVRANDAIDVESARAVFERPRKVSWLLEQDGTQGAPAHVRVKSAGEPLVLGLDHGVIEAQVVPVSVGEAFAVDVATDHGLVRVAVHGTHLRIARSGNRVVIDLTEGVVAIGVPPRTGVTYGTTVAAPAHVELDATNLATLRIDHTPASVRAAVPLGGHELARPDMTSPSTHAAQLASPAPTVPAKEANPRSEDVSAVKRDPPKVPVHAREAISAAVRQCAIARGRSGDVHVTVSSSLRLRVSAKGVVESAQFSPPLLPDVQSCAAEAIYKTKLEETGLVTIPIQFSY
jgi:hypothetical protein